MEKKLTTRQRIAKFYKALGVISLLHILGSAVYLIIFG
jgi:hypothetical protein